MCFGISHSCVEIDIDIEIDISTRAKNFSQAFLFFLDLSKYFQKFFSSIN